MPQTRTITQTVYSFDELDDSAKERARDWYRGCLDSNDFDCVIDDFVTIAEIIGISFDTHVSDRTSKALTRDPNIYWSGFCQQGDGACFEGSYTFDADAVVKIREHCSDEEVLRITDALHALQVGRILLNRPTLCATIKHTGRYYHEHSVDISVYETEDDWVEVSDAETDTIEEAMRDLMRWLYKSLETENDWIYSAECVDDNIQCNEYEFTEEGEIA
jgi:hypothetical protein